MNKDETEIKTIDAQGRIKKIKLSRTKRGKRDNKILDWEYLNAGYYVVTPIFLGVFLGLLLDKWMQKKPLFLFGGIIFGTCSSFYNLWRLIKKD